MAIDPNNLAGTAKLTFADDFNTLSLWNGSTGTWKTNHNFGGGDIATFTGNGELQWYINDLNSATSAVNPWSVSGGILTLSAAPASAAIKPLINNYNYTSGMISSQGAFSQTYGYFEMRAQLPDGQGLWPAFWLLPTTGSWRPEIDVMEVTADDTTSLWQFSHPADNTYDRFFNTRVTDMSAGYHTYGVDWQADKITFYFDGRVTGVAPTAPDMHGPMYLIANLAVGGSWAGAPDATTQFPAQLKIDYIRAYQDLGVSTSTSLTISPGSTSASEGTGAASTWTYTVTRSGDVSAAGTVAWAVTGSGANPVNAADFVGGVLPSGVASFAAGQTSAAITFNVAGDSVTEANEAFTVTLSNPSGAATITSGSATGTILNDDAAAAASLALSPASISQSEGANGETYFVYTVTRSGNLSGPSQATWSVAGSGANPASASDFTGGALPSGTVWFGGGEFTKLIYVSVRGDTTAELDEQFTLSLSNPVGAALTTSSATGLIVNDDAAPSLALSPASLSRSEGATGSTAFGFIVTRSGDLSGAASASWAVTGSGANPATASDFTGAVLPSGSVSFAAGQATATINVNVAGDTAVEMDESFVLTLSNPVGASISQGVANGVIINDDAPPGAPSLAISPGSNARAEGASGSTAFTYTVTRTGDLTAISSVAWTVSGNGANAANGADFTGGTLPSGNLSFAAGQSTATLTVNVAGDATPEADETFLVTLSNPSGATISSGVATGVITNDDGATPAPSGTLISLSPGTLTQPEGQSGTTYFVFNVNRTGPLNGPTTASYSVVGSGPAPADGADFVGGALPSGMIWFGGGESVKQVWLPVRGDTVAEGDEQFTLSLWNVTGASVGVGDVTGVITNDDGSVTPSATNFGFSTPSISQAEGNAGSVAYTFNLTRTGDLSAASSANWSVSGSGANPATAADFQGSAMPAGTVNFVAGQSSAAVTVYAAGDTAFESDETFTITLSNPVGGAIVGATATGVIANDDAAPAIPASGTAVAISATDASHAEGASGDSYFLFQVLRTGDLRGPTTLTYAVTGSGPNPASASDFQGGVLPTGTVWFGGGESSKTIWLPVRGDTTPEADEGFTISITGITGGTATTMSALGLIQNDDGTFIP